MPRDNSGMGFVTKEKMKIQFSLGASFQVWEYKVGCLTYHALEKEMNVI